MEAEMKRSSGLDSCRCDCIDGNIATLAGPNDVDLEPCDCCRCGECYAYKPDDPGVKSEFRKCEECENMGGEVMDAKMEIISQEEAVIRYGTMEFSSSKYGAEKTSAISLQVGEALILDPCTGKHKYTNGNEHQLWCGLRSALRPEMFKRSRTCRTTHRGGAFIFVRLT